MPFFRSAGKLVYYAHVPKCGGSSIAYYLEDRFGSLGLYDRGYMRQPEPARWSRTSPQHVDASSLERMIPLDLFDAIFAVVRHPVDRAISTYHFQREVERTIPDDQSFGTWLAGIETLPAFAFDNHVAPMDRLVPEGATVFHLEHGLDPLIHWLDLVVGRPDGPRAILPENSRGAHVRVSGRKVEPTESDLAQIGRIYAADFERFGYRIGTPAPLAPAPEVSPDFMAERNAELRRMKAPMARLRRRVRRRLQRL